MRQYESAICHLFQWLPCRCMLCRHQQRHRHYINTHNTDACHFADIPLRREEINVMTNICQIDEGNAGRRIQYVWGDSVRTTINIIAQAKYYSTTESIEKRMWTPFISAIDNNHDSNILFDSCFVWEWKRVYWLNSRGRNSDRAPKKFP